MTDATITLCPGRRIAHALGRWLARQGRRRTSAARQAALCDHILRDIGVGRPQIDLAALRTRRGALRKPA
jgi:uncharacterized protein YjiS (DUF1127 family)